MGKSEILLESGTNELEVAEFFLGKQSYGVNVAKIREIVLYDPAKVTFLVGAPPGVLGTIIFRGHSITITDLHSILDLPKPPAETRQVILVTEFNQRINAFLVDGVARIHRISWSSFTPMHPILSLHSHHVSGSFNIEKREILILDFEHIINELFPIETQGEAVPTETPEEQDKRKHLRVFVVEDSKTIQRLIVNRLKAGGISQVRVFGNGEDALKALRDAAEQAKQAGKSLSTLVDLVVSDIEMPVMDGLSLCKTIKTDKSIELPVIMFSSMITPEMARKCLGVGADRCYSKPDIEKVIVYIDELSGLVAPSDASMPS